MNKYTQSILLTLVIGSCSNLYASEDKGKMQSLGQQIDSAVTAIEEFTVDKKDTTIEQVDSTLNSLDDRIEELEARLDKKWDSMDAAARKEARHSLQVLRKNRTRMAEWMGSMKQSSGKAWDKMKSGFSDAFSTLQESWKEAEEVEQVETTRDSI